MSLPLVDINLSTAVESWPLLVSAISSADFIALDLELSGLGWHKTKSAVDTAERYKLQCDVVSSYSVLSVGVACFQWQPSSDTVQNSCKVETFNVWLLSQQSYTIDPSSAKFLIEHGFDFNKQFRSGLPYSPAHACSDVKLSDNGFHLPTLFGHILAAGCPVVLHNGLIDLLYLYSHFYAPLPSKLDVFMADLSEMFVGGVYDTKAIAQFQLYEQASFLEYIFRKKQRENKMAAEGKTGPHLELVFADYAALKCVELVSILPPPLPTLNQLMHVELCTSFSRYGYCHQADCRRSHNVLIVITMEEHKLELTKAKRKRKKELQVQRKRQKTLENSLQLGEEQLELNTINIDNVHQELSELFESDLSAAKAKFTEGEIHASCLQDSPTVALEPSFGHRAGFDAFMTGYCFACISISLRKLTSEKTRDWLSGVEEMKNKLANRGKAIPLHVTKSFFTNTSQQHRIAQSRISLIFKNDSDKVT